MKVDAHFTKAHCTVLLSTLPPSLQYLKLVVNHFIAEENAEFPRNLTTFHLSSECDTSLLISKLPPTLLNFRLKLKENLDHEDDWSKFPPKLTKLKLSCLKVSTAQVRQLPRGLVHLTLPDASDVDEDLLPALFEALPPELTRLPYVLVQSLNEVTAAALPRQIVGTIYAHVSHRALHLLPQGVTSVGISDFSSELLHEVQGFPSSLRDISIPSLDDRTAKLLPPHLKSLAIDGVVFTPSILTSIPPTITELMSMYGCPFKSVEDWKLLHRELERLDTVPSVYHHDMGTPIPTICPESSSWLPNRLVFLTLGRLDIQHAEWFDHLPSTLEAIRLHVVSIPSESFQHIQLPNLTQFHLTASSLDSTFRTGPPPEVQSIPLANLIRTLPFSLEEFVFKSLGTPITWNYCKEDLMNLPPFLQTLLLPEPTTPVTSQLLPYLPRTLTGLRSCSWFNEHLEKKKDETVASNEQELLDLASQYGFSTNGITKMFRKAESHNQHFAGF
jgi:hypothetical protein